MKIVGLSGKRGSGKTTLASLLEKQQSNWVHLSLASPIKEMCRREFGLTEAQTDGEQKEKATTYLKPDMSSFYTPRDIMIMIGKLYREIDPLFWIKKVEKKMKDHKTYVISDVRFRNEADWINNRAGYIVRLNRNPELSPYKGDIKDPSETELDSYDFHYHLPEKHNVTLTDLKDFASELHEHVMWKQGGWLGPHGFVYQNG